MRFRLLTAAVLVALGACDASSAAPWFADSAADVIEADASSSERAEFDAGQREDAASAADGMLRADAPARSDAPSRPDATPGASAAPLSEAAPRADAGGSWPLGMNDVSILTPLPVSMSSPVLLRGSDPGQDGAPLVPKDLYERIGGPACFTGGAPDACMTPLSVLQAQDYERLHLVAIRFDLCDRSQPRTCTAGEDGRLRLVWQPLRGDVFFADAALHAFFSIPHAELPSAVATLRDLARLQAAPITSALTVSPGLSSPRNENYAEGLRAFVRAHAQRARLVRLALNAQPAQLAQVRWLLRGLERGAEGMFREIAIPGSLARRQDVLLRGAGFEASPAVDLPAGLTGVLSQSMFDAASPADQARMLEALVTIDHPMKVAPDTAPCVACHASSALLDARFPAVDVQQLQGAYLTSYNVSIDAGRAPSAGRTLRALGYVAQTPLISRRVAHETAQVLSEIERMFP